MEIGCLDLKPGFGLKPGPGLKAGPGLKGEQFGSMTCFGSLSKGHDSKVERLGSGLGGLGLTIG